jgi:hypothetical protein
MVEHLKRWNPRRISRRARSADFWVFMCGQTRSGDLPSPALLIDLDRFDRNADRVIAIAGSPASRSR